MKIETMKKENLGNFPTPLQYMQNLSDYVGLGKLYIKRDDLSDVGMGGNKIRKLEYLVHDAKEKGYTTLMTFGGPQSNHCRLTAAAAAKCNMKCILMLEGYRPDYCSGNLVLDQMFGADVYFLGEEFMNGSENEAIKVARIVEEYEARGEKVYSIPIGGGNEIGAMGYISVIPEIMQQMKAQNIEAKYLVTACGSIGTFAGLWIGAKYYNAPFKIKGISICPPIMYNLDYAVEYINKACEFYELDFRCTHEDLDITYETYAGIGYNIPDENTRNYIRLLGEKEAIVVDPTYTGKAFAGFMDMVQSGIIPKGENAIILHSGGIPAIWTKEHLDEAQKEIWGANDGRRLY